jgi:hypothetical protein
MPKTAKAAPKSAVQNPAKDLFSDLPEPTARRLSGKARRPGRLAGAAEARYTARDIEVLEGLEPVRRRQACISAAPTKRRSITCSPR